MSTRLREYIRDTIVKRLLDHRFKADQDALKRDFAQLARDVYDDVFPKVIQRKMNRLPKDWLAEEEYLQVKFGEAFENLHLDRPRRFPYGKQRHCVKVYPAAHPLTVQHHKLKARQADLKKAARECEVQARAALGSVTTVAALLKRWPEIAPFVPNVETVVNLPALPLKKLNEAFRLPVKEAAKAEASKARASA